MHVRSFRTSSDFRWTYSVISESSRFFYVLIQSCFYTPRLSDTVRLLFFWRSFTLFLRSFLLYLFQSSVVVPKKSALLSTNTVKSRKIGLLSNQVRSGVLESHEDPASDLPVRGLSPPTRDTDYPVPNSSKALHEPTEKQLQSARVSLLLQYVITY